MTTVAKDRHFYAIKDSYLYVVVSTLQYRNIGNH